jgi:mannose-6-phosphate isomerase-like protein (cupin superfamily)
VLTETQPNGGPPLHTHTVEEGHVVLSGRVTYLIGERQVTAEGPYIARVPAGVAHTFINSGTEPVNVVATFPAGGATTPKWGRTRRWHSSSVWFRLSANVLRI